MYIYIFLLLAKLRDEHPRKQLHHHPQQGVYSLHQENLRAQGQCAETRLAQQAHRAKRADLGAANPSGS